MQVKGSAAGNYLLHIASSGVEPYVYNGYLDDQDHSAEVGHSFVNYKDANSDATFTGTTELGVYQYIASDEYDDRVAGERNVYFKRSGKLSNSAATALSIPAAQVNVATLESDALAKHLNASRKSTDDGGVWISYFGGKNQHHVSEGADYDLKTNGVLLAVFTWLLGTEWNGIIYILAVAASTPIASRVYFHFLPSQVF